MGYLWTRFVMSFGVAILLTENVCALSSNNIEPGEEYIDYYLRSGVEPAKNAPRRVRGEGPFEHMVIKGVMVVDGTGAPPFGPTNVVVKQDRIVMIASGELGDIFVKADVEPESAKIIDGQGQYLLPGFIDAHAHFGTPTHAFGGSLTDPEYVSKLLLAHGITTIRDVGTIMGLGWTLDHKRRSEAGSITAPRIFAYPMFPTRELMTTEKRARQWIKAVHKRGADGIKFENISADILPTAVDQAQTLGMETAYHHSRLTIHETNALDSAKLGVDSLEHALGLPEVMFEDKQIQHYPVDYNLNDFQQKMRETGKIWEQTSAPGSEKWRNTISTLVDLDYTLVPTFSIYEANRDVMRARAAEWHQEYTLPSIARAFEPNPKVHGSHFYSWTTADEISWKQHFRVWMQFINDYKNAGGRVAAGSDAGFIYKLYGFSYIRELELFQEAGFHPLEVIQAATIKPAELLGMENDLGSISVGKKADMVLLPMNPLNNLKVLYGTGQQQYNFETESLETVGGIRYTIKDGIVWDATELLDDVRAMVRAARLKEER